MVKKFSSEVEFIAILNTKSDDQSAINRFKHKYDLGITTIIDKDGSIARSLGVYSTPQAVLLSERTIYYKGNYNKARFCLSKNTKFAEQALIALVDDEPPPVFPSIAVISYGCELPSNTSNQKSLFNLF